MKPLLLALLSLLLGRGLLGQDDPSKTDTPHKPDKPAATTNPGKSAEAVPNPFAADDVIKNLFGFGHTDPLAFQPLAERPALPDMRLRGIVHLAKSSKPAALVELTGFGSYTVRAGESIAFTVTGTRVTAPAASVHPPGIASAAASAQADSTALRLTGAQRERAKERGALPQAASAAAGAGAPKPFVSGNNTGVVVREPVPIVLRVERIAKDGVVVEIGTMGQYLIIR